MHLSDASTAGAPPGALLLSPGCGRLRGDAPRARKGRAPSVSTDDWFMLASVSNYGNQVVVIRHDRWSSISNVWVSTIETRRSRGIPVVPRGDAGRSPARAS
jgi:hypothetical protein